MISSDPVQNIIEPKLDLMLYMENIFFTLHIHQ